MKIKLSILIVVLSLLYGKLGATDYCFYIQLTDKNNSPYTLSNPADYLSVRAIERRAFFNIPIDSTDLPVNPQYVTQLANKGLQVFATTKWLNGVTVVLNDSTQIEQAKSLPFVKSVQYTGLLPDNKNLSPAPSKTKTAEYNYGDAEQQINLHNGKYLHQNGYTGENIHIAIFDTGFRGVNANPAFKLLRDEGRLIDTKDFVNPQSDIFTENIHGAFTLSTMAAEINDFYIGTAPKASYLLIKTESFYDEYLFEPDLWISGAEYADSLGVDVMTTSLGYTTFDDPAMNYTYSDLDGKTARASIAANMAFEKGILVVNSAGNEGNNDWKYISVPADAEGVITVGSVTKDSVHNIFSSLGPTYDGRIKPNLCAIGSSTALLDIDGSLTYGSGTSFSTPIIAGLVACYLQAAKTLQPSLTLQEIKNNIYESANQYSNPNNKVGYGIPDFKKALNKILLNSLIQISDNNTKNKVFKVYIREDNTKQILQIPTEKTHSSGVLSLYSTSGQLILRQKFTHPMIQLDTKGLPKGIYILKIENLP